MEQWRKIRNINDCKYSVSTDGQVRDDETGKIIKQYTRSDGGYYGVFLKLNNKSVCYNVHRLVAETFLPNPDNLRVVHHIDENKHNNSIDNLMWCTYSYNSIANDLGNRRIREYGAGRKMRKCEVDGLVFDCIADAEKHFNIRENCLCVYLRKGYKEYKGHKIKYLN